MEGVTAGDNSLAREKVGVDGGDRETPQVSSSQAATDREDRRGDPFRHAVATSRSRRQSAPLVTPGGSYPSLLGSRFHRNSIGGRPSLLGGTNDAGEEQVDEEGEEEAAVAAVNLSYPPRLHPGAPILRSSLKSSKHKQKSDTNNSTMTSTELEKVADISNSPKVRWCQELTTSREEKPETPPPPKEEENAAASKAAKAVAKKVEEVSEKVNSGSNDTQAAITAAAAAAVKNKKEKKSLDDEEDDQVGPVDH